MTKSIQLNDVVIEFRSLHDRIRFVSFVAGAAVLCFCKKYFFPHSRGVAGVAVLVLYKTFYSALLKWQLSTLNVKLLWLSGNIEFKKHFLWQMLHLFQRSSGKEIFTRPAEIRMYDQARDPSYFFLG